MRDMSVRGVLIYCSDYRCRHSVATSVDQWPDDFRLSDIDWGSLHLHGLRQAWCRCPLWLQLEREAVSGGMGYPSHDHDANDQGCIIALAKLTGCGAAVTALRKNGPKPSLL